MYHMYSYVSSCYDAEAPDWYKWTASGVLPMVAGHFLMQQPGLAWLVLVREVPLGSSWDPWRIPSVIPWCLRLRHTSAKNGCWWIHSLGKCWELPTAPVINRRSNTTINGVNYGFLMPWLLGHFEGEVPFACWSNRNHSNELLQEVPHFFLQQIQTSISAGEKLHKITCELFFMRIPVTK